MDSIGIDLHTDQRQQRSSGDDRTPEASSRRRQKAQGSHEAHQREVIGANFA
jgi:hypothetical protein